jgi:hypothetical protein
MTDSKTPQGQNSTTQKNKAPKQSAPAGTGTLIAQQAQGSDYRKEYACRHHESAKWWHRIGWSQVVLDLLLLRVGIKLAFIYSGQLTQMIESNRISRESLESVQRAFITYHSIQTSRNSFAGKLAIHIAC